MADFRRLHLEILAQVTADRAREQIKGQMDFEQDDDLLTLFKGPVDMTLAADAAPAEFTLPTGAALVKFIAMYNVSTVGGVEVIFDNPANDAVIVSKPVGSGQYGYFLSSVTHSNVYLGNPTVGASVDCTVILGCSE